jgi:filamentous hemagglutinin
LFDSDNTRGQVLAVLPEAESAARLAAGQLSINSGELNNDAGLIYGASSVTVNTGGAALNNVNSGTDKGIAAGNGLNLVLGHLNNQTGFIGQQGAGDLTVTAANLDNQSK